MKINNRIFAGMAVLVLLFGLVLVGCAGAPKQGPNTDGPSLAGKNFFFKNVMFSATYEFQEHGILTVITKLSTSLTKKVDTGTYTVSGNSLKVEIRNGSVMLWALDNAEYPTKITSSDGYILELVR